MFSLPVSALSYRFACGIYYSICTEWNCIINMNVHNHRYMKNNNTRTHFARQQAVRLQLSLHQDPKVRFWTLTETDLIWLLQEKQGTFSKNPHQSSSDVVQVKFKMLDLLFCSCVKTVCVVWIYTRAMKLYVITQWIALWKKRLVYNVEQRETGIVLVKLYEYSVKYVSTETTLF